MSSFSATSPDHWVAVLQATGHRITTPCRAVMRVLDEAETALTPQEILSLGRRYSDGLGLATVYRSLDKLEKTGIVERIHQHGDCSLFFKAANGHEHFLICTGCRRVERFKGDDLSPLERGLAKKSGFTIKEHWLQFNGLCRVCKEEEK